MLKQKFIYPLRYHRKKIIIMMIVLTLLIPTVCLAVTQADLDAAGGLVPLIFSWVDEIFGVSSLDEAKSLLNITFQNGTIKAGGYTFKKLAGVLTTAGTIFRNTGIMLLFCFFGIHVIQQSQHQSQMVLESYVRQFVMLILGMILIANAMDLVFEICNFFTAVGENMLSSSSADQSVTKQILALKKSMYTQMGLDKKSDVPVVGGMLDALKPVIEPLKYLLELLIPYLLAKLSNVVVSVVCWTRFVQVLLMAITSPVMLCDLGDNFINSNALKGIKNIAALALSGPMILLSLFICKEIQLQIMSTAAANLTASSYTSAIWSMAVIAIVQLSLVTKASNIAKQVLGMA